MIQKIGCAIAALLEHPATVMAAVIVTCLFAVGPFAWAFWRWHCWWLPSTGICH